MNSTILKYSIITLSIFTFTFSQQERLMWEDLVDKKGIKYAAGSKKPFTGRVFDNYKNKLIYEIYKIFDTIFICHIKFYIIQNMVYNF